MVKKYAVLSLLLLYTASNSSLPSKTALQPFSHKEYATLDEQETAGDVNALKLAVSLFAIISSDADSEDIIKRLEKLQENSSVELTQAEHKNKMAQFDPKSVINQLIAKEQKSVAQRAVQKQKIETLRTEIDGFKAMFNKCCPSRLPQARMVSASATPEQQIEQLTKEVQTLKSRYQKYCCTPSKTCCS